MTLVAVVLRFLLRLERKRLARHIAKGFEVELSRKLDALLIAEEALGELSR